MKKRSPGSLLITLFIVGVLALNFPLLSLFSQPVTALGLPLLYLYIFAWWAVLIAVLALAAELLTWRDRRVHVALIVGSTLGYIALLFAIARFGDKRAEAGQSIISNPYVYALSMAVYCTAWTFYGSVGRAANTGVSYLAIYIGPTLMAALWWFLLRKMIRISKVNRITSIADFIASRYGKSIALGGLVTIIAVVGIVPYIALQLRAVSTTFTLLWEHHRAEGDLLLSLGHDTALWVALILALFAILFGTRHLDVTEHHEGLVAAIAFESIVKLVAFLAVGYFVTQELYDGTADLFQQASERPEIRGLFTMGPDTTPYSTWLALLFLSMMAILFLPRQFQMSVVENVDERHLKKAIWLFPLYLLVITLFAFPIALGGLLRDPGGLAVADTFVLTLPLNAGEDGLALLAFLGGVSAATGMVIVATVALSTMVSNDLVLPALLRLELVRLKAPATPAGLSRTILVIRRLAIIALLVLGYFYHRATATSVPLVSIGLVSFAAAAQFAPAVLGGMYWKGATRAGALTGLLGGSGVWAYTLLLPALTETGRLSQRMLEEGPWGIAWLRPYELLGLSGLDPITHSLFWSMVANAGGFVIVSLLSNQSAIEHAQAMLFVDIFKHSSKDSLQPIWRGTAPIEALRSLLYHFLETDRTNMELNAYARRRGLDLSHLVEADAELVEYAEKMLSGAIGATSARVAVASVVDESPLSPEEVMQVLDETSQLIASSRELQLRSFQLERKSLELEGATEDLRTANERLKELDQLKDEFLTTMTHELRTPLTSIRALSEILHDNPRLDDQQRIEYLRIILRENRRLTRLISEYLDLSKMESGVMDWSPAEIDLREVISGAVATMDQVFKEESVEVRVRLPDDTPPVVADRDRVIQVILNLLSNAAKYCAPDAGRVSVELASEGDWAQVLVRDNGRGIRRQDREIVFEKFRRSEGEGRPRGEGTGLGLPISRQIIQHFGGRLWVESEEGYGSTFIFRLPLNKKPALASASGHREGQLHVQPNPDR